MDATKWMNQAFEEALLSVGTSRPNPAVGAIVVQGGVVVGRGRTQKPGNHHAEVMALLDAGEKAAGADMYVTLEPCCFFGRTPPCTDAILKAKIKRVFVSVIDGNPKVNGGGIQKLRSEGVPVVTGVLEEYGHEFYRGYHHFIKVGLPWVDVKIAQSLDGFIAGPNGERTQITGEDTARWVHHFRARVDAIVIGSGTLRHDNPQLTVRNVPGNNPNRIILCKSGLVDPGMHLFNDGEAPTLLYVQKNRMHFAESSRVQVMEWRGEDFASAWHSLLEELGRQGYHRVLVEAGATIASLLLGGTAHWNRFFLLTAPKILGEGLAWRSGLPIKWKDSLHLSRFEGIGCDFLTEFENVHGNHSGSWRRTLP